jgi:glyoxylase-like metal-dependent hydrolase (beta-lactamase superfamily II)
LHDSVNYCNLQHEESAMRLGEPIHPELGWIRRVSNLEEARATRVPALRIAAFRHQGLVLGDSLRAGARVRGVKTLDNATLPYPTRFAFNGAVPLPWPFVIMVHRTLLVQLDTDEGRKNVLFNPTDAAAARNAPFFRKLQASVERVAPFAEKLLAKTFEPLESQLAKAGVTPEQIDVIAFDHFHTQDLRPLLGNGNGTRARFPNAKLLAPQREWEDWDGLHPMQRAWMIEDGKAGVPRDKVIVFDADVSLGHGCLLLRTPGHTTGNQTLFVHGADGVFGCSENGCSADNWSPEASRIPGLKSFARQYDVEVVLNANTPELGGEQYASMILERSVVDPVPARPEFVQMFPSSEVTATALAPMVRPSMVFRHRDSGAFAS